MADTIRSQPVVEFCSALGSGFRRRFRLVHYCRPPRHSAISSQEVVAMADQIGSNEELFRYVSTSDPSYIDRARRRATHAVRRLGFSRSDWARQTDRIDFGDLFATWSPRPLQLAVAEARSDHPLLILESETGSGKTEAAIWRFAKLWKAGLVDALYFALPTRAAAVQLHRRVDKALRRVFPTEARLGTVLAVPGYIRAGEASGHVTGWDVTCADDPDDAERLARWSAEGVRKFLSATAAVGTVDQALLSGLRVKRGRGPRHDGFPAWAGIDLHIRFECAPSAGQRSDPDIFGAR